MSFGFGLGLPHYVAVLGGGGPSPPTTVYFLSLTTNGDTGAELVPLTLSVDSSGNVAVFGYTNQLNPSTAYNFKLNTAGALSSNNLFSPSGSHAVGVKDSSDNYYAVVDSYNDFCGTTYRSPEVIKLDSSLAKTGGTHINCGSPCNSFWSPRTPPIIDNSGNIWVGYADAYGAQGLLKVNSALTSINSWGLYYINCCNAGMYNSIAITPSNTLIGAGANFFGVCCCCSFYYVYYPYIQSLSTTNPLAVPNWTKYWATLQPDPGFAAVAVNTSGDVYTNYNYYLFKFNSSGALQWTDGTTRNGYSYSGTTRINSIAIDSSGFIYAVGTLGNNLVILKIQDSGTTATLQYSRTLTPASGSIGFLSGWNGACIQISGSTMYITAAYTPAGVGAKRKTLVFKVPADGSLTQTISVGGVSFTYALGGVTQSTVNPSISTASYPLNGSGAPAGSTALVGEVSLGATNAVTVL